MVSAELNEKLTGCFPEAHLVKSDSDLTGLATPGAYLLALQNPTAIPVSYAGKTARLTSGDYAYAGSARGPGGMAARLNRHFRREKREHWHIDQLTIALGVRYALAIPDGDECAIVARLCEREDMTFPLPGFGSSDCRQCSSHLMRLEY